MEIDTDWQAGRVQKDEERERVMTDFLQLVAKSLLERHGNDLSRVAVVFPNKRASLFLNDYLAAEGRTPLWAPRYMTVNELFRSLSRLRLADPIDTVCRMYRHYTRLTGSEDTLDFFYGWGERLLADFDDVDKNMAPPEKLFRDLADYEEIGAGGFLDEEQTRQLTRFLDGFAKGGRTAIKDKYLALWRSLLPLYNALRDELSADGLAYEGQLFRSVAEEVAKGGKALPAGVDHVAAVGFNVIDRAEHTLFFALREQGKADFYWDYDTYYARPDGKSAGEAGFFMQQNLRDFPNALGDAPGVFDNFLRERGENEGRELVYVSSPTDTAQAKCVTDWLRDGRNFDAGHARRTAVVLCNEALLQGVLHALPSDTVTSVNITKGFPMGQTSAFALVDRLMTDYVARKDAEAARRAKAANAAAASGIDGGAGEGQNANHAAAASAAVKSSAASLSASASASPDKFSAEDTAPASANVSECRAFILSAQTAIEEAARRQGVAEDETSSGETAKNETAEVILYREAHFQAYATLSRFLLLIDGGRLDVRPETLFRLVRQVMRSATIPFHGEPAQGLQVMGVLETRCLDFDNLLVLSAEEGTLPQRAAEASFIPYLLRVRFGLTTSQHKTAVFAYYFHRMLQRARRVQICYNNSTQGTRRGEMSRFMRALLVESGLNVKHFALYAPPRPLPRLVTEIEKTAEWVRSVHGFSPSAVNDYLRCPLAFYYKRVMGLSDETKTDELIAANVFGTLFHDAAQYFHERFLDKPFSPRLLEEMGKEGRERLMTECVRRAFNGNGVHGTEIVFRAVYGFLSRLVRYEMRDSGDRDIVIRGLEQEAECHIDVPCTAEDGGVKRLRLYGIIDRFEEVTTPDGVRRLRVIDYKTGGQQKAFPSVESVFSRSEHHYTLQTFLYSLMMESRTELPIVPALYYVNLLGKDDYSPYLCQSGQRGAAKEGVLCFQDISAETREALTALLEEMLDTSKPFGWEGGPKADPRICRDCSFRTLCGR